MATDVKEAVGAVLVHTEAALAELRRQVAQANELFVEAGVTRHALAEELGEERRLRKQSDARASLLEAKVERWEALLADPSKAAAVELLEGLDEHEALIALRCLEPLK